MKIAELKRGVCAVLTAIFFCTGIQPVFAKGERTFSEEDLRKAMQDNLIKQQALDQIKIDKTKFVQGIVGRWSSLTNDIGTELRSALMTLSDDKLIKANNAVSISELNSITYGPDAIGDPNIDLVFFTVAPCRILDTRVAGAGGIMVAGVTRNFDASNTTFAGQGGSSTSCGLPSNDAAAIAVTVVSVTPAGAGNLRAWRKDDPVPTASVLNYSTGLNLASATIIPLKQNLGDSLEFSASANVSDTHFVADVVGYFWSPNATAVNDNTLFTTTNVGSNATFEIYSPICSAGYRVTGGGLLATFMNAPAFLAGSRPSNGTTTPISGVNAVDRWLCQGTNTSVAQDYRCFVVCAQIPGR